MRVASFLKDVLRFIAWAVLTLIFVVLSVWLPSLWQPYGGPGDGFTMIIYAAGGVFVGGILSVAIVGWLTE